MWIKKLDLQHFSKKTGHQIFPNYTMSYGLTLSWVRTKFVVQSILIQCVRSKWKYWYLVDCRDLKFVTVHYNNITLRDLGTLTPSFSPGNLNVHLLKWHDFIRSYLILNYTQSCRIKSFEPIWTVGPKCRYSLNWCNLESNSHSIPYSTTIWYCVIRKRIDFKYFSRNIVGHFFQNPQCHIVVLYHIIYHIL